MKNVILGWDVAAPIGTVTPGGMVVLYGDAPLWKYCKTFYRAIAEGASVVAIGHGIDMATDDAGDCIVAYSCEEEYTIGKPISQRLGKINFAAGIPVPGTTKSLVATPLPD